MWTLILVLLLLEHTLSLGRDGISGICYLLPAPWEEPHAEQALNALWWDWIEEKRLPSMAEGCTELSLLSVAMFWVGGGVACLRLRLRLIPLMQKEETSFYSTLTMCLALQQALYSTISLTLPITLCELCYCPILQMEKWRDWRICSSEWFSFKRFPRPIWPLYQPETDIFTEVLDRHAGHCTQKSFDFVEQTKKGGTFQSIGPGIHLSAWLMDSLESVEQTLRVVTVTPQLFSTGRAQHHSWLRQKIPTTHLLVSNGSHVTSSDQWNVKKDLLRDFWVYFPPC